MEIEEFKNQVNTVFSKIHELNSFYDTNAKASTRRTSDHIFYWLVIGPIIVAAALLLLLYCIGKTPSVAFAVLFLISIGYIGMIAFQISLIIEERRNLLLFLKNPLTIILNRVKDETTLDYSKLCSLNDVQPEVLCHAYRHLITERESFERRTGILVGALEKVGLIPGFATLYLAWSKLAEQKISIDPWIAGAVFVLYFFAFYFHLLFTRLDRYIATLDEIIKEQNIQVTHGDEGVATKFE